MKRYKVTIESGYAQTPNRETIIDFEDAFTDEEIEAECAVALQGMFENMSSGWHEVDIESYVEADYTCEKP